MNGRVLTAGELDRLETYVCDYRNFLTGGRSVPEAYLSEQGWALAVGLLALIAEVRQNRGNELRSAVAASRAVQLNGAGGVVVGHNGSANFDVFVL